MQDDDDDESKHAVISTPREMLAERIQALDHRISELATEKEKAEERLLRYYQRLELGLTHHPTYLWQTVVGGGMGTARIHKVYMARMPHKDGDQMPVYVQDAENKHGFDFLQIACASPSAEGEVGEAKHQVLEFVHKCKMISGKALLSVSWFDRKDRGPIWKWCADEEFLDFVDEVECKSWLPYSDEVSAAIELAYEKGVVTERATWTTGVLLVQEGHHIMVQGDVRPVMHKGHFHPGGQQRAVDPLGERLIGRHGISRLRWAARFHRSN
jgi:hypothetical protein